MGYVGSIRRAIPQRCPVGTQHCTRQRWADAAAQSTLHAVPVRIRSVKPQSLVESQRCGVAPHDLKVGLVGAHPLSPRHEFPHQSLAVSLPTRGPVDDDVEHAEPSVLHDAESAPDNAAARGLAVVVMEPLRGGSLTRPAPREVAKLWDSAPTKRSQAEWALQWVWNDPDVSLVLSGMSAMSHVEENLASAERSAVGSLSEGELRLVDRVRDAYRALAPIPCTNCRYCQPCPNAVAIPRIFELYNDATAYGDLDRARVGYARFMKPEHRADRCVACGACESACPQRIEIIAWLKKAHAVLAP